MRRIALLSALALALVIPGQAFAVNANGSTTETINGPAATISLTVPATVTYTGPTSGKYNATVAVTNLSTNNPTGMKVSVVASDFTGSGSVTAASSRTRDAVVKPGGWQTGTPAWGAARALGFYTGSNVDDLANTTVAQVSPTSFTTDWHAESAPFTAVNGTYSGTLAFTAVTNP